MDGHPPGGPDQLPDLGPRHTTAHRLHPTPVAGPAHAPQILRLDRKGLRRQDRHQPPQPHHRPAPEPRPRTRRGDAARPRRPPPLVRPATDREGTRRRCQKLRQRPAQHPGEPGRRGRDRRTGGLPPPTPGQTPGQDPRGGDHLTPPGDRRHPQRRLPPRRPGGETTQHPTDPHVPHPPNHRRANPGPHRRPTGADGPVHPLRQPHVRVLPRRRRRLRGRRRLPLLLRHPRHADRRHTLHTRPQPRLHPRRGKSPTGTRRRETAPGRHPLRRDRRHRHARRHEPASEPWSTPWTGTGNASSPTCACSIGRRATPDAPPRVWPTCAGA